MAQSSSDLFFESSSMASPSNNSFETAESLKFYTDHSEHVKIKDELVVPNVKSRMHMDYEVGDL